MPSLSSFVLFAAAAGVSTVHATFAAGTVNDNDFQLTYSGYASTLKFCSAFRTQCIDYVGNLNYHHGLDCVTTQAGPTIYARCGGIEKNSDGTTGLGESIDFTSIVCPLTSGCTIAAQPVNATTAYTPTSTRMARRILTVVD